MVAHGHGHRAHGGGDRPGPARRVRSIALALTTACALPLGVAGPVPPGVHGAELPGVTTRVSVSSSEAQSDGPSHGSSALSADGRFAVFTSEASNLVSGDTNGVGDVFVRDLSDATTRHVSVSSAERQGSGGSMGGVAISPTGRYVAFTSTASNLVAHDTNGNADVFVRDLVRGTTRRVSLTDGDRQSGLGGSDTAISSDGRYVAFVNGGAVLVRDRTAGSTENVATGNGAVGGARGTDSAPVRISGDGRYVVFTSFAPLVPGDTNSRDDVFLRDRRAGTLERVSVSSAGTGGHGHSRTGAISQDGRLASFFSEASDLVLGDTNAGDDVFTRSR